MTIGASGASAQPDPASSWSCLRDAGEKVVPISRSESASRAQVCTRSGNGDRSQGFAPVLVALESSQRCDRQLAAYKLASPVAREEYVDRAAHGTIHGLGLYRRQYAEEHALQQL